MESGVGRANRFVVTYYFGQDDPPFLWVPFGPGADFLWLLLQHVLPKGLRRARNFGFLHPNSKRLIQLLHLLVQTRSRPRLGGGQTTAAPPLSLRRRPHDDCPNAAPPDVTQTGAGAQGCSGGCLGVVSRTLTTDPPETSVPER